jgi:hypothetical protein
MFFGIVHIRPIKQRRRTHQKLGPIANLPQRIDSSEKEKNAGSEADKKHFEKTIIDRFL